MAELSADSSMAPHAAAPGPIVAKAGRYYRIARYLMTLLLFAYGAWSIYDGFISWPNWPQSHPNEKPKTDADILLNKVLGVALPPLGVIILLRALYLSRGECRLEDGVLHMPGHPPIPLDRIHSIDRELWDRKGIAIVEYDPPGAPAGANVKRPRFRLDDFVYEREPIDKIFQIIEQTLLSQLPSSERQPVEADHSGINSNA